MTPLWVFHWNLAPTPLEGSSHSTLLFVCVGFFPVTLAVAIIFHPERSLWPTMNSQELASGGAEAATK